MTRLLVTRGLSFAYPGADRHVIRDLNLVVDQGEMLGVHGPSGSGKSTLLYLLGLFLSPSKGSIVFDGTDTDALGDRERSRIRAHEIGFVLQDAALHPAATLLENVAEGALYSGSTHKSAVRDAQLLLEAYGLSAVAHHRPAQVSGGQAQRAALCRALIRKPRLVLADEPTGNVDQANADRIAAGLRNAAASGAGVVIVTHSPTMIDVCDRALALG